MEGKLSDQERRALVARLRAEKEAADEADYAAGWDRGWEYGRSASYRDMQALALTPSGDLEPLSYVAKRSHLPTTIGMDVERWVSGWIDGMLSVWEEVAEEL